MQTCGERCMLLPSIYYSMMTDEDQVKKSRHQRHQNEGRKTCPVCGLTIRRQEVESHYQSELEQLQQLTKDGSRSYRYPQRRKTQEKEEDEGCSSDDRFEEYLRLKRKRETRQRQKLMKSAGEATTSGYTTPKCPVCNMTLTGTAEEMNEHAEACLLKQSGEMESNEVDVNVDDDESFEEYTWAGQSRIRATSLLEGGLRGCGYKTVKTSKEDNIDDELDVEGDESAEFGPPQFTEDNLIHLADSPENKTPTSGTGSLAEERNSNVYHDRGGLQQNDDKVQTNHSLMYSRPSIYTGNKDEDKESELIKSLKAEIIRLKESLEGNTTTLRCLVCLDVYKRPAVSIQCWHVYCEDCWMRTLGAKKLCPQCQMITNPGQLRTIYL